MDSAKWNNIKQLLTATLDLPEGERDAFLLGEGDASIRREVEKLLKAHDRCEGLFDRPFLAEYGLLGERCLPSDLIGKTVDDYLILERIGEGGMGVVFLAEHRGEDFTHRVALKLIKRGMDTDAVLRRFLTERRILSQLRHQYIARLLDGGSTADGLPYFVMEYVEGDPIKKYCGDRGLGTRARLELFRKVCEAVAHAHQNLVVHRDLKPSNITVTPDGSPKLLDFGISKLLSPDSSNSADTVTGTNMRIMTPEYASPEQLSGGTTTVATDVYSLGVVLYELLTGVRPFESKSERALVHGVANAEDPQLPSSVVSQRRPSTVSGKQTRENRKPNTIADVVAVRDLRGDLDNIILKSMRREPEDRYSSVHEFSEDIRRHLAGLPVVATADSVRYRLSKFVRRHKRGVMAAAAAAVVVCGLSGLAAYQGWAAMIERDKANRRFERLRDVARMLLTDTTGELEKVPGTLRVRKDLTQKSVELLDSVYDESTTDTAFLLELADAYQELARTQLWSFRQFDQSRAASERAIQVRRRIVELDPENRRRVEELYKTIASLNEVYGLAGDRTKLLEATREIETFRRQNADVDPSAENLSVLALHQLGMGDVQDDYGMPEESRASYKESINTIRPLIERSTGGEQTPKSNADLSWWLMIEAEALDKLGRDGEAFQNFTQAAELAQSSYRADSSLQPAFNQVSRSHRRLGEIYEKRGDVNKSLEMYKFGLAWLRTGANNQSLSRANYYFGVFFFANRCALALQDLGRSAEAEAVIEEPLKDYNDFLDSEENAASLVYAREPFIDLTRYFAETGRIDRAAGIWQQHFDRLQRFLDRNPNDIGFLFSQIETQSRIGDIYSSYDTATDSFITRDTARLEKALQHYIKADELYRRTRSIFEPTESEKNEFGTAVLKISRLRSRPSARPNS